MIKINDELNIHFPMKLKPRDQQIDGLQFVKDTINSGNKYAILNLPTGVGKSYFTIMFMNWYKNYVNNTATFDILTNSKILQDQYIKDYPFIKNLKGRSNYMCDPHDTNCSAGYEICKSIGPRCGDECPYIAARNQWNNAQIGLTNFHFFNTCALYVETILDDRDSSVLIIDEAHEMEPIFTSYISMSITAKNMKKYGFTLKEIEDYDREIRTIKSIPSFIKWIDNFKLEVEAKKDFMVDKLEKNKKNKKLVKEYSKYVEYSDGQLTKMKFLIDEYRDDPSNWTLDVSKNNDKMYSGIVLEAKPVFGDKYMYDKIYSRYDHVIFMSATINKNIFCRMNGLEEEKTNFFTTNTPFDVNNRKIFYMKVGKMSYKEKADTMKKQEVYIKKILKKYKGKKGIIHTSNYEIANYIQENVIDKRLLFHTSENRDEILNKHIASKDDTVLVSPSMTTGVDLVDDLSRFQIILKIPYPFLGSQNIKTRQKLYPEWYNFQTISDLMQACGRSVRNMNDYADTFILDSNFSDLLKYSGHYLPNWFSSSIVALKV